MAYRTRTSSRALGAAAFFVLVATLFFWLAALSTPIANKIYYLETRVNDVRFGNFGWCALDDSVCYQHVGYWWRPQFPGGGRGPTGALILVALTAAFGTFTLFSLLHSVSNLTSGGASFFLLLFTNLLAFISFLLVVIIFGTAHRRFNRDSLDAHYGPAFPLLIVGWLLYVISIPLVVVGWFRQRHYRDERAVHHQEVMAETTTTRRRRFW